LVLTAKRGKTQQKTQQHIIEMQRCSERPSQKQTSNDTFYTTTTQKLCRVGAPTVRIQTKEGVGAGYIHTLTIA
jgi:hypothetical protein